jgi:sugar lactone lactonase YvrE
MDRRHHHPYTKVHWQAERIMTHRKRLRITFRALGILGAAATTAALLGNGASGQDPRQAGDVAGIGRSGDATFSTVFTGPVPVEGLTADRKGNLYTAGRVTGAPCPVWRVPAGGGDAAVVGNLPAPCSASGLAFNAVGQLFVAAGDRIDVLTPDAQNPPTATTFVSAVPGANGLAFGPDGDLWISDGNTGQGRVWRVPSAGGAPELAFRVQPMVNDVNVVNGVGGVGRDPRALPPGSVTITPNGRNAADTAGSQHLVANGLAFTGHGDTLYVADTARGAIWRVRLDRHGEVRSPVGCDTTFAADTLCLDDVFVAHPYLEGADGIALDRAGNIWAAANERDAVVVVSRGGRVQEFFRNAPDAATRLRNTGPLEFPTSPFLAGNKLCLTQSDGARRDNFPNSGGDARPGGATQGKIACMDQSLPVSGLPLPIS